MDLEEHLWRLYEENREFTRFHEGQRAAATALIGGGAGALAAAITADGLDKADLHFAILLIALGFFGLLIALKSTEKLRRHNHRAGRILAVMCENNEQLKVCLLETKTIPDRQHEKKYWLTSRLNQSALWLSIHYIVLFSGFWLLVEIVRLPGG